MATYKSYVHVLRLDKPETDGILNCDKVFVTSKLDGTASLIYSDDNGKIHYGSRRREIDRENDNGNFAKYFETTDDRECLALKDFCRQNPNLIVFGEWLGGMNGTKFLGTIKKYLEGGFFVYSVYDTDRVDYVPYDEYHDTIRAFYHRVIPAIACLDHPTVDDLTSLLDKCNYNLPDGEQGEGIVIHPSPIFHDSYGHTVVAKIVAQEYYDRKKENHNRRRKNPTDVSDLEREFVDTYCTNSEMAKEQNKIMIKYNLDSWENSGKYIGQMMNNVVDSVMENLWTFFRKRPTTIDLGRMRALIQSKVREFLGLG